MRNGVWEVDGEWDSLARKFPFDSFPFGFGFVSAGGVDGGGDIVLKIGSGSVRLRPIDVVPLETGGRRIGLRPPSTSLDAPPPPSTDIVSFPFVDAVAGVIPAVVEVAGEANVAQKDSYEVGSVVVRGLKSRAMLCGEMRGVAEVVEEC